MHWYKNKFKVIHHGGFRSLTGEISTLAMCYVDISVWKIQLLLLFFQLESSNNAVPSQLGRCRFLRQSLRPLGGAGVTLALPLPALHQSEPSPLSLRPIGSQSRDLRQPIQGRNCQNTVEAAGKKWRMRLGGGRWEGGGGGRAERNYA
jgi:hypothetical protein